jgi:hypothetical protein
LASYINILLYIFPIVTYCFLYPIVYNLSHAHNVHTLRHKFAVYCDDIAAGTETLEELYDLYEALLCCCAKAGIQVKAAKIKFGVREVTFHNYTISEHGMTPKDANLCSIRNLGIPTDVTQVRAFLGCAQQMV